MGDKCWRQVGNRCKVMRPKAPRVRDKCGRRGGDKCKAPRLGGKGETSVNSCGPRHAEWETRRPNEPRVGDKCGRQVWETSVNSCGRHPEWETRGRQGGDKCQLMRPKEPRVRDKCGRQGGDKCKV